LKEALERKAEELRRQQQQQQSGPKTTPKQDRLKPNEPLPERFGSGETTPQNPQLKEALERKAEELRRQQQQQQSPAPQEERSQKMNEPLPERFGSDKPSELTPKEQETQEALLKKGEELQNQRDQKEEKQESAPTP